MEVRELIHLALKAREHAYIPYSGFAVGAALECGSGEVYQGCNIENAAHTPACCAERTAFFKAVYDGQRDFTRIAIVGGQALDEESARTIADPAEEQNSGEALRMKAPSALCAPCGVCRQVMMEFCDPKTFEVILASSEENYKSYTLEELLPLGFGPASLD